MGGGDVGQSLQVSAQRIVEPEGFECPKLSPNARINLTVKI